MGGPGGLRSRGNLQMSMHFHCAGDVVRGVGGLCFIENALISLHLYAFGGGVGGSGGQRIIENLYSSYIFVVWEMGRRSHGRPLIHCKCIDFQAFGMGWHSEDRMLLVNTAGSP